MRRLLVLVAVIAALAAGCESKDTGGQPAGEVQGKTPLEAIEKGLTYMFSFQKEDGSIVNDQEGAEQAALGATGLAVNAAARAPKEMRDKFKDKMEKACQYVLKKQMTDGSFAGSEGLPTYTTAVAVMALHNADPEKYSEAIKKGQEYLVRAQYYSEVNPDDLNYGGWTYGEKQKDEKKDANMSTTHYALMALKETNLPKDHEVFKRAATYLTNSQNNSETNTRTEWKVLSDGGFIYGPKMTRASGDKKGLVDKDGKEYYPSYASMTYAGFTSLIYANVAKDDQRVLAALNWIKNNYTLEKNTGMGYRENEKKEMEQQGLYYFYNAFARAMDAWGQKEIEEANGTKHNWAQELSRKLIEKQHDDGSWVNPADRFQESMKTIVTGYSVDALNTCAKWLGK
jgi:hypothetical protein